jgi:alkyl hydroperoxide reductase subunit AhpF
MNLMKHIMILGGGYAGVSAAVRLRGIKADVTLVNHHSYTTSPHYSISRLSDVVNTGPLPAFAGRSAQAVSIPTGQSPENCSTGESYRDTDKGGEKKPYL